MHAGWSATLGLAIAAGACGNETSASEQCELLADRYCRRVADCDAYFGRVPVTRHEEVVAECLGSALQTVACEDAGSVSAAYDQCIADLAAHACSANDPSRQISLPASCVGAILLR